MAAWRRWQPLERRLRQLLPLLLLLIQMTLLTAPLPALAASNAEPPALAWPQRNRPAPPRPNPATSPHQEVAPPAAVQQLRQALDARQPRLTILAPADGAFLEDGPWELRLKVEDWPLVDAGPLGLGPHLMLQLDDQLPEPLLTSQVTLPALAPGSHRLTVYAVRPWGEVVKAPGAFRQIRLHRVAVNPLALPAPGSPQLLAVVPPLARSGDPVLLDWLLLDAPLQNLRNDDTRWRLRVTVNGDSFLVQNQTPLWLKGWRPGSNAVLLELVDARGEPLNPPFNSLVRSVRLEADAPRPAWLGPPLAAGSLAQLLGETPAPTLEPQENIPSMAEESSAPAALAPDSSAPPPEDVPEPAENQAPAQNPGQDPQSQVPVPQAAEPQEAEPQEAEPQEAEPQEAGKQAAERHSDQLPEPSTDQAPAS